MMKPNALLLIRLIFATILVSLASGCASVSTRPIDLDVFPPPYEILVYDAGGIQFQRGIAANSQDEKIIRGWIASHAKGWASSTQASAPLHVIRGKTFELNFQRNRCIANYRDSTTGAWQQLVREMDAKDEEPPVFKK
jgi:hypothetical protein